MSRADDVVLTERVNALSEARTLAGDCLDPAVAHRLDLAIEAVRERLAFGVDHTVVALAGGTGSGKSSLFNAISGIFFADVGVKRPTTSRVSAVSWSDGAGALLDWIGVDRERRIQQSSDLSSDALLPGLVLLDLPDHDSIEPAHREIVDKVLPLVDLLIWVVDPQKYADDALHSDYLAGSCGMEATMVIALNQIDTAPVLRRDDLRLDLERLLTEAGLGAVHVLPVSAKTGDGLADLREVLIHACERQSIAAGRTAAELDAAAELLATQTTANVPWRAPEAIARELPSLIDAAAVPQVAGQLRGAIRGGHGHPGFYGVDGNSVALLRARWLMRAGAALAPGWQRLLGDQVSTTEVVRAAADQALEALDLDTSLPRGESALRWVSATAGGLGLGAGICAWLVLTGRLALANLGPWVLWAVAGTLILIGCAGQVWAVARRRSLAARRADDAVERATKALAAVMKQELAAPTEALLARHSQVRELMEKART